MLYLEGRLARGVRHWPLPSSEAVLGRSQDCDIVVNDPSISRRHLRIRVEGAAVEMEDLDSANGLWVDGERVPSARIEPGQWFSTGTILFTVRRSVTLGSGDADAASIDARPSGATRPTSPPPSEEAIKDGPGSIEGRLLRRMILEGPWTTATLDGLLAAVAMEGGIVGAVVLRRSALGWSILSSWGTPPDPGEVERIARADPATEAPEGSVEGWSAVRLERGGTEDECLLLLRPAEAVPPALDLFGDACARAAAETVVTAPITGSPAVETGLRAGFVTVSESGKRLLVEIDRIGVTDIPVLLQGESGTGKELLARRLHDRSRRSNGPFVALNCSALPEDLVEAELFGIHRGVATGVTERQGRFLQASGGTLFLDEIGDFPLHLQPKLLRALESGEVLPLGAPSPVAVDVRIVAATNTDLGEALRSGRFRRDLHYRLAGAEIAIPPLRERPEDILPLARHFVRQAASRKGAMFQGVDLDAARILVGHPWPGNARELRHVIFRAVALADGPILHRDLLPASLAKDSDQDLGDVFLGFREDWRTASARFAGAYFKRLIEECGGNMTEAARRSGLGRSTLYEKLKELGLR